MAASAVLCSFALLSGCSDDDVCKVYIPEAKALQIKNFDLGEELREEIGRASCRERVL